MKPVLLASLAGLLSVAAALPAAAQPGGGRGERFGRPGHFQGDRPHQSQSWQQGMQQPAQDTQPGGGRMSPEERRQLRRDINDAGRDLYPPRERPPRR